MDSVGIGLLVNLVFWVVSVSALVFLGVWAVVELIDGLAQRTQRVGKTVREASGRGDSRRPSTAREEAGEPYRKAS